MNYSNVTETLALYPAMTVARQHELNAWIGTTLAVSLIGVLNNIIALWVTCSASLQKSGVGPLIVHFVAVNLLMCLVTSPSAVLVVLAIRDGLYLVASSCFIMETLFITNISLVNWSDVGLTANRVVALYFPNSYKSWITRPVKALFIGFPWIVSLGVMLPVTFLSHSRNTSFSPIIQCAVKNNEHLRKSPIVLLVYLSYAISAIGSLLIVWKCFTGFSGRRTAVSGQARGLEAVARQRKAKQQLNIAKMLLGIFVWNLLCTLPGYVIFSAFPDLYRTRPVSVMWVRTPLACQYAFMPCVLILSNTEYQRRLRHLFHGHRVTVAVRVQNNARRGPAL
ncbi:hypothetical protein BV898_12097 [Hypsibius exemplaris]|uniref:G-protein coupled receptors family 1 profile domain-containing protein n=1 Tax=Hypsibius exemplaris TaxID=2072580 RepID=A0A1W0WEY9_HYPEX|nr:hypothetical protein BV898_12097 [Hypsibius exemplaris]